MRSASGSDAMYSLARVDGSGEAVGPPGYSLRKASSSAAVVAPASQPFKDTEATAGFSLARGERTA